MGYTYKFILKLMNYEYLEWSASIAVEKLGWFDKALITLCVKNKRYVLYDREISDCLYCLRICLQEALYNRYPLNPVPKQDIGYLHNEDLSLPLDQWDSTLWKWEKNLLWVAAGRQPYLETWLYNDTHGNIIMHVTELYYWLDFDKSKGENYITYSQFMKNYKPTFRLR